MSTSILKEKSQELDASLADLITADVNDAISTLRISLVRALGTLGIGAYYIKPLLDSLYEEVKDLTTN